MKFHIETDKEITTTSKFNAISPKANNVTFQHLNSSKQLSNLSVQPHTSPVQPVELSVEVKDESAVKASPRAPPGVYCILR